MTATAEKETAQDVLARIKRNSSERDYCLEVLDLGAGVQAQGIEIESVSSFGYNPKLLTKADKTQAMKAQLRREGDPFIEKLTNGGHRLKVYNYVRHTDGTTTTLTPMLKAPIDDPAKSQVSQ